MITTNEQNSVLSGIAPNGQDGRFGESSKGKSANEKIKRCNKCGLVKPHVAFSKCKKGRYGRVGTCKDCIKIYNRLYAQSHIRGEHNRTNEERGIESWSQVEGVIRELAELQARIKNEYQALQQRIALIRKYSDDAVEPEISHRIALERMLEDFLGKLPLPKKGIRNFYRFGVLKFCGKKMSLELDTGLAGQMRDKP